MSRFPVIHHLNIILKIHSKNNTTKLHSTLRLEGKYEVALVEMSYPQNWIYKKNGVITFKILKED
jgi:hypothetical protein